MSIFKAKPKCVICRNKDANPAGGYKNRCKRCGLRYDSQGIAFIVYCDFHRFTNKGRGSITFWVSDDRVQRAPVPYAHLLGIDVDELYMQMDDIGRHPLDIEKGTLS